MSFENKNPDNNLSVNNGKYTERLLDTVGPTKRDLTELSEIVTNKISYKEIKEIVDAKDITIGNMNTYFHIFKVLVSKYSDKPDAKQTIDKLYNKILVAKEILDGLIELYHLRYPKSNKYDLYEKATIELLSKKLGFYKSNQKLNKDFYVDIESQFYEIIKDEPATDDDSDDLQKYPQNTIQRWIYSLKSKYPFNF